MTGILINIESFADNYDEKYYPKNYVCIKIKYR